MKSSVPLPLVMSDGLVSEREILRDRIAAIETELSNPEAKVNGRALSPREYTRYRHSLIKKLADVKKAIRKVNKSISDFNRKG